MNTKPPNSLYRGYAPFLESSNFCSPSGYNKTNIPSQVTHTPVSWTVDTPQESLCRLWRWEGWCLLSHVTVSWTRYRGASVWGRDKDKGRFKRLACRCMALLRCAVLGKSCFLAGLTLNWTSGSIRQHCNSLWTPNPLSNVTNAFFTIVITEISKLVQTEKALDLWDIKNPQMTNHCF